MGSDLIERLRLQAVQVSGIAREMAEAKSLRQAGNPDRRIDLYMWPVPEETVEGQAADEITALRERVAALEAGIEKITRCGFVAVEKEARALLANRAAAVGDGK